MFSIKTILGETLHRKLQCLKPRRTNLLVGIVPMYAHYKIISGKYELVYNTSDYNGNHMHLVTYLTFDSWVHLKNHIRIEYNTIIEIKD